MQGPTLFQRILVPVDFSAASDELVASGRAMRVGNQSIDFAPASMRSIELAAALARAYGGRLRLIHATPTLNYSAMYTPPAGVALPPNVITEIHESARRASVEALSTLAALHCEGVTVECEALPGVPLNVVLEEVDRFHADLVVLAASGRSRVTRFFLGSTADRVIRQASCPVLVIPAHPHE